MSSKYALIFVLAALCCLVATEAAAQRRSGAIDESRDTKDSTELDTKRADLEEHDQEENQANTNSVLFSQNHNVASTKQDKAKETIIRTNTADARARRVVRRRSGPRRGGNARRRRRGGNRRRRGGNRRRRGGKRNGRRGVVRRRGGRPLRG